MTSPKKGRPRHESDRREAHVFVRVTVDEKDDIEIAAKREGLGVGAWARNVLVKRARGLD